MSTDKKEDRKSGRVTDKINDILGATIDMEAEKEEALNSIMEAASKLGIQNQNHLNRIASQVKAALDNFQGSMFGKIADLGNNLWTQAKETKKDPK